MSTSAAPYVPQTRSLLSLKRAAAQCHGCPLWELGTQTVFGEGLRRARLMLVGEQPGDKEDLAGRPFVGPSGRVLDAALQQANIDRSEAYVTNIVKHFKWEPKGKRRLHRTPNAREIGACLPWLEAELDLIRPLVLVCLGATAAKALLGPQFRVSAERGKFIESGWARYVLATVHPSSILRSPNEATRAEEMQRFVSDLAHVRPVLAA